MLFLSSSPDTSRRTSELSIYCIYVFPFFFSRYITQNVRVVYLLYYVFPFFFSRYITQNVRVVYLLYICFSFLLLQIHHAERQSCLFIIYMFFLSSSPDTSRRTSELSIANSNHFYEEVFFELIDGLKKSDHDNKNEPPKYERISIAMSDSEGATVKDIPFVPPRRSSIREESTPIRRPVPVKRPLVRSKSPEVFREMFDLPEESASQLGSLNNLDQQMLQLSQDNMVFFYYFKINT